MGVCEGLNLFSDGGCLAFSNVVGLFRTKVTNECGLNVIVGTFDLIYRP